MPLNAEKVGGEVEMRGTSAPESGKVGGEAEMRGISAPEFAESGVGGNEEH
ncbi:MULTISPECIES: hypothetical protein [unclassified Paenibacillus]|uniref:hypothetical protein n=1 Tax=unclassified Paenibacillus TaxID=185978 RepID=UPI0030FBBE4C